MEVIAVALSLHSDNGVLRLHSHSVPAIPIPIPIAFSHRRIPFYPAAMALILHQEHLKNDLKGEREGPESITFGLLVLYFWIRNRI